MWLRHPIDLPLPILNRSAGPIFWTLVLRACHSAWLSQFAGLVELAVQFVSVFFPSHPIMFVSFAEIHVTVGQRQKKSARCSDWSACCIHSPMICALKYGNKCLKIEGMNAIAHAQYNQRGRHDLDVPPCVCFILTHFTLSTFAHVSCSCSGICCARYDLDARPYTYKYII